MRQSERTAKAVNSCKKEMVRFLRDLIRAESVTGYESEAQELIRDKLRGLGADVDY